MSRLLGLLAVLAVGAAVAVGLTQASSQPRVPVDGGEVPSPSLAREAERRAAAPPELAALQEQAGELLPADEQTVRRRLRALEGHPVVINKWASWCEPCREEAPVLQRQAAAHGGRVAFVGLNWRDPRRDEARAFLRSHPLPFPSYEDRDGEIAGALAMPSAIPSTLFLDERGELAYLHQGPYLSDRQLAEDIARYLPDS